MAPRFFAGLLAGCMLSAQPMIVFAAPKETPLPLAKPVGTELNLPKPPAATAAVPAPKLETQRRIDRFELENGLQVVVLEVPDAMVVTHMLWYRVGASDDPQGKSGLAHFVEHMMFQGTDHSKPGDFMRTIERMGGEKNAFTTPDFTAYYVHIAKQNLPEVMKQEADRMQFMNPPEPAFAKEREVILEERRQQVDTDPGARLREEMDAALFIHHPYRTPVIGWQAEMETLNREDVIAFQRAHYAPNNALLVLAGGITLEEAKALANKYYAPIPAKKMAERVHWVEPKSVASQKLEYRDAQVQQPSYMMSWQVPSVGDGVAKALPYFVLSSVLGESNSSRIFKELVIRQHLASEAGTNYVGLANGPGHFLLWAVPTNGDAASSSEARAKLEGPAYAELVKLAKNGVDKAELDRVKSQLKASSIYAMDSVQEAASLVGQMVMLGLPADYLSRWPEDIEAVTPAQVQDAAKDLLARRHVEGWLLPPEGVAPKASPAVPTVAPNARKSPGQS